jgi:hypothetical protein
MKSDVLTPPIVSLDEDDLGDGLLRCERVGSISAMAGISVA